MCFPTRVTHIPSNMCSTAWEKHVPCDMTLCSPTRETFHSFAVVLSGLSLRFHVAGFGQLLVGGNSTVTVKLKKPWTLEIFMECYCVSRNKPIRHGITKPQTAMVISLLFWGLLTCPELYFDWPVHKQYSRNFSVVHGFLRLTGRFSFGSILWFFAHDSQLKFQPAARSDSPGCCCFSQHDMVSFGV